MKQFLIVLFINFALNVFSQSGIYTSRMPHTAVDGTIIKWTLNLNEDGTFLYHFLRDLSAISKANTEENYYTKGTWKLEGKSVVFFSKEKDHLNEIYILNLNNSKARYNTKSPRDKSDNIVKTALRFYESETFHIKGLELFKE